MWLHNHNAYIPSVAMADKNRYNDITPISSGSTYG